ncbi:MAG: hypothetical protein AAF485_29455, partial [Chloroflexota bacterium]
GVLSITLPAGFRYIPGSTIARGEGWPMESREPVTTGQVASGQTLTWGPYNLPAAGITVHNPFGIHTLMPDCSEPPGLHLEGAKQLIGNGGYVKQLFFPIDTNTTGPSECARNYVLEAYARNLIPILRIQGHRVNGIWQAPDPGPDGDYSEIAQAYANYVAGLPRRDTNPLYIEVWNEPDLWIEWSNAPNATQYARFFVAVSNAIKQLGDARIRVINGALTPGNMGFLHQMLQVPGFRDAFDVWSSHCYPYNHPATYNIHNGTAQYGTYAIDCYLDELAVISSYGRTNVKVMLTETGYPLGDNTFGFEGFPPINETNRAAYISNAFATYWQQWPEIVAVTPFELVDTSGHWSTFDWVYPYYPYPKHAQFDAVEALPKPTGVLNPYGYQISFRVKISDDLELGTYTSQLSGSDQSGATVFADQIAPMQLIEAGTLIDTYLPIILKGPGGQGAWYKSQLNVTTSNAIVPDTLLTIDPSNELVLAQQPSITYYNLAGQPQAMTLVETSELAAILLKNGAVEIVDLQKNQQLGRLFINDVPQAIITASPHLHQAYISLADGLAKVDLEQQTIIAHSSGWGRLRGMAWDQQKKHLFVADPSQKQLLIFDEALTHLVQTLKLDHQPDQLIFKADTRQLFITFPAAAQIIAVDVDTLRVTAKHQVMGGPLLDMVLDPQRQKLYGLHALAPGHRGLT